ncbi:MAG: hypothetical protein F4Z35_04670 [Dehalococcoidia bacterium]|nr:hypothetical protein [Dehalococcoidia bacterium]
MIELTPRTLDAAGTHLSQETDYAKIMDGLGGYGERVTDPDQIHSPWSAPFGSGKAALLDVVIGPRRRLRGNERPLASVETVLG